MRGLFSAGLVACFSMGAALPASALGVSIPRAPAKPTSRTVRVWKSCEGAIIAEARVAAALLRLPTPSADKTAPEADDADRDSKRNPEGEGDQGGGQDDASGDDGPASPPPTLAPAPAVVTPDVLARALAQAAAGATHDVGPDRLRQLLSGVRDYLSPLSMGCSQIRASMPANEDALASFAALVRDGDLSWLAASTSSLGSSAVTGQAVRQALTRPPSSTEMPPPARPEATAPTPARPQGVAELVFAEAQRALLEKAFNELSRGACRREQYHRYLKSTCGVLGELVKDRDVSTFPRRLASAAREDLERLPVVVLAQRAGSSDELTSAWVAAEFLREGVSQGDWPGLLRGLASLECPVTMTSRCASGTPARLREVSAWFTLVEGEVLGAQTLGASQEQRNLLLGVIATTAIQERQRLSALAQQAGAARGPAVGFHRGPPLSISRSDFQAARSRAQSVLAAYGVLQEAPPERRLDATLTFLRDQVPGLATPLVAAIHDCVAAAERGDLVEAAASAATIAKDHGKGLPPEVRSLIIAIAAMSGKSTPEDVMHALATSPWLTQAIIEQLEGKVPRHGYEPFGKAPTRRPDREGAATGLSRYVAGLRAGYVYQYWAPQEIPDVNYTTVGLNLLRAELILNVDDVPALSLLQGYLRYEIAPGGQNDQDELIALYQQEATGWQAILADIALNLPLLGGDDAVRGPVFGFRRRFFLASAEALKDYWYYDDQTARLLVPGDRIRTSTVMTLLSLGLRGTEMAAKRPVWGWELGGFYLDYQKPYTHGRFTTIDRSAIFDSVFRGYGGYATGRVFVPSLNPDAPGTLSVNGKLGRAEIELDDIAAEGVLPANSELFVVEAQAEFQMPVFFLGGFFFGGATHVTYRTFGDFFSSGETDPGRVNDQTLNDDFIFGLTAQAGYLL